MQMNQACRLVTISANHIMASVSAKFPVTASREFLEIAIFVVPLALNSKIILFFARKRVLA